MESFRVTDHVKMVPPFKESDVDTYLSAFESLATRMSWPEDQWTLLLQGVLVGKARAVYAALPLGDQKVYPLVKNAIQKAYELVPEAYRQNFRRRGKHRGETYLEFAHAKGELLERWVKSVGVHGDYEGFREIILVEAVRADLSTDINDYVDLRGATSAREVAMLADEHAMKRSDRKFSREVLSYTKIDREQGPTTSGKEAVSCRGCGKFGHSQKDCRSGLSTGVRDSDPGVNRDMRPRCFGCGLLGHLRRNCKTQFPAPDTPEANHTGIQGLPQRKRESREVSQAPVGFVVSRGQVVNKNQVPCKDNDKKMGDVFSTYRVLTTVGNIQRRVSRKLVAVRDTGCAQTLILASALPDLNAKPDAMRAIVGVTDPTEKVVPAYKLQVIGPMVREKEQVAIVAAVKSLPLPATDLIIGNDIGAKFINAEDVALGVGIVATRKTTKGMDDGVEKSPISDEGSTGNQEKAPPKQGGTKSRREVEVRTSSLTHAQKEDDSLKEIMAQAVTEKQIKGQAEGYYRQGDGLVCRKWTGKKGSDLGQEFHQVVVPQRFRTQFLEMAHDSPVAGHLGVARTYGRLRKNFHWPYQKQDVIKWCRTCEICQRMGKPGHRLAPIPLKPIEVPSQPFQRLIVDCVGPLPRSQGGKEYLLTMMCATTRYAEATPLKGLTAKEVVEALIKFFTTVGFPRYIQTDQGTNFESHLFLQVMKEMEIHHVKSAPYHPETQGALERFHQTLKTMVRAYCGEHTKDWEAGLPLLLFALRSAKQESLGFSPFEMIYAHPVKGPLDLLKDHLIGSPGRDNTPETVRKFRQRLATVNRLAQENLLSAQAKMKQHYDRAAEDRCFEPGDRVLARFADDGGALGAKFVGPYEVKEVMGDGNYRVATPDRVRKKTSVFHANLLKRFEEREIKNAVGAVGLGNELVKTSEASGDLLNSQILEEMPTRLNHLSPSQRDDIIALLQDFKSVFLDAPSRTNAAKHDIVLTSDTPIRHTPYRVNPEKRELIRQEITYMLNHGIIEPSNSDYSAPVVLVKKRGGRGHRLCTDYRKLNKVTVADSFPLPRIETCIDSVGHAKFVSKFDLLKGYWQVPLSERAKRVSAFVTPDGLYQYTVTPFGMRNAPATFQRMMNYVTSGLAGCEVYLDDVVVYSNTWEEHLDRLRALLVAIERARLTINLNKTEFGHAEVEYLGHKIGGGKVRPLHDRVQAMRELPRPKDKKGVRRFLGMAGFYRGFVRNFSSVVAPLTDLTKARRNFQWTTECERAFVRVKEMLTSIPVLQAPQFHLPFSLQVDASDRGIGAVLMQEGAEGVLRPVAYFSKKLEKYQKSYSTVEKEALGVLASLQHFEVYITSSKEPVKIFTDHNPLVFIERMKNNNQRLLRWSLQLQEYNFTLCHIKGSENKIADALSRADHV